MDVEHTLLTKKFEEEVNSLVKSGLEKQLAKKWPNVSANEISKFFLLKILLKKDDVHSKIIFAKPWFVIC